jgi:hypothetical protein
LTKPIPETDKKIEHFQNIDALIVSTIVPRWRGHEAIEAVVARIAYDADDLTKAVLSAEVCCITQHLQVLLAH